MKHKKLCSLVCVCTISMVCSSAFAFNVCATADNSVETLVTADETTRAEGLIRSHSLGIVSGVKTVKITAGTYCYETMAKIGFTNIEVQRSSNGTSGWVTELTLADDTASNAVSHTKNSESKSVVGGYYYRVKLDHYAKETGWFPDTQSITGYSNVVWVPKS